MRALLLLVVCLLIVHVRSGAGRRLDWDMSITDPYYCDIPPSNWSPPYCRLSDLVASIPSWACSRRYTDGRCIPHWHSHPHYCRLGRQHEAIYLLELERAMAAAFPLIPYRPRCDMSFQRCHGNEGASYDEAASRRGDPIPRCRARSFECNWHVPFFYLNTTGIACNDARPKGKLCYSGGGY